MGFQLPCERARRRNVAATGEWLEERERGARAGAQIKTLTPTKTLIPPRLQEERGGDRAVVGERERGARAVAELRRARVRPPEHAVSPGGRAQLLLLRRSCLPSTPW